jgi:uncharacterized protein YbjT (DUF2867 family)
MYVITAATGNIGRIIATELLANGKKVRVIGRDASKLEEFVKLGADAMAGDVTYYDFVKKAFAGATTVFCLIPPNNKSDDFRKYQNTVARNYADSVKENKINNTVLLSSIGAHLKNGAGVVDGLADMETYFAELKDVNILNLRPSYFMENILGQIGVIKLMGIAGAPAKGDIAIPVVATKDIGAVAAKRLLNLDFKGNTVEYVLGPRNISYNEITAAIGKAIGKPDLKYVQFSYDDFTKNMVMAGYCSENVATGLAQLSEGINNGGVLNHYSRTEANTTPTTVEEFAKTFAQYYNQN